MTVKNLIQQLQQCDPNAQIHFVTYCGTVDGIINEISANQLSPSNKEYCVYLAGEITHFKGERIQQTYTNEKKLSFTTVLT